MNLYHYIGTNHNFPIMQGPYNRNPDYTDSLATDAHLLVYHKNEETGGADLYETYNTKQSGVKLITSSSASYLYDDTASPRNNQRSVTAAGIPMAPIILTYDEAVNDRINHCLAITLTNYGGTMLQLWIAGWTPPQSGLYYLQLTSFNQNAYWNPPTTC